MSDRITGLIAAVLALAFFAGASQLESPFFADPVGPKTFPILISAVAFLSGAFMVFRPDAEPTWPALSVMGRLAFAAVVMALYAWGLKPLGFLLPTAVAAGILSYQIKPRPVAAALSGLGLSIGLFVIFRLGFGLSLFALPRWLTAVKQGAGG